MFEIPEWYWIIWIAVTVLAFAIPEAWAIINGNVERADKQGDTLSEYVRKWLGVWPDNPRRRQVVFPIFVAGIVGLVGWLIFHFMMPPPPV